MFDPYKFQGIHSDEIIHFVYIFTVDVICYWEHEKVMSKICLATTFLTVLQIRGGNRDNLGIFSIKKCML